MIVQSSQEVEQPQDGHMSFGFLKKWSWLLPIAAFASASVDIRTVAVHLLVFTSARITVPAVRNMSFSVCQVTLGAS